MPTVQPISRLPSPRSPRVGEAAALDSHRLLEGQPRIAIRHRGETYWLHETRQGKLLLTK